MANNTECLTDIIGITRQDCECIEEELGDNPSVDWFKKSKSGFYLHEVDGVVSIDAVKDVVSCEQLPDFYKRIIASSITETADDISASIHERYKKKESNFTGFIGARTAGKVLTLGSGYMGVKIEVNEIAGSVLVIKGLGTLMNIDNEFDIAIYRRYSDIDLFELVDTIEGVNSVANTYTENVFEEKIILPMQVENEGQIEYYLLFQSDGSLQPRGNLASCGCGRKEQELKKLINYGGVNGDDIEEMGSWPMSDKFNGLVLDAEIRCNAEELVCLMYNNSPEWAKYIAHAVVYKAAWKIHKAVLTSTNITQEIMANRESVNQSMNEFDGEYWTRIKWLVQNVDLKLNDCYVCDNRKLKVSQILL